MRTLSLVLRGAIISCLLCTVAFGCTVLDTSLRKEFRRAESVFVGRVLAVRDDVSPEQVEKHVPKDWMDWTIFSTVRLAIGKQWKGDEPNEKDFVAVAFYPCGCNPLAQFEVNKEYVVFSRGDNFVTICDSAKLEYAGDKIKQLDRFWFRTWARLYPF